jgi:hypothetical protein
MGLWSSTVGQGNTFEQSVSNVTQGTNYQGGYDYGEGPGFAITGGNDFGNSQESLNELATAYGGEGMDIDTDDDDDDDDDNTQAVTEETGIDVSEVPEVDIVEQVLEWAEKTGSLKAQEDRDAILADPKKWMESKGFTLEDAVPTLDADAEGTAIDMGEARSDDPVDLDVSTVDKTALADQIDKVEVTDYSVKSNTSSLTDDMMVDAATKTMSKEGLVNPDEIQIDIEAVAAGENAVGRAVNDWASIDFTNIIDTTTPSGRELARQLGEGNYLDKRATTAGQIEIISRQFINDKGQYVTPVWARPMVKSAAGALNITGAAAEAAIAQAMMQSVIQVADKDAKFFQTLTTTNLDNKQKSIINKATILANMETSNLNARQTALVTNAQNFLKLDIANLTNTQQAEIVNKQARIEALFTDTAAMNAQRIFGAENANDFAKFFGNLNAQIDLQNNSEINALKKFNSGEINDAAQFVLDIRNSRDQFLDQLQYNYSQFNAKWRQDVTLEQFKTDWDATTTDVKNGLDLTSEQMTGTWDHVDSLLDYVFKYSQNENEAIKDLTIAQIQAQAGRKKGGGFLSGLVSLAGSFLSTGKGAEWLISLSDSRFKNNIQKYNTINGIGLYKWDWSEEAKEYGADKLPSYGVVAQELYKTHPEAVFEKNGYLHVNYEVVRDAIR